MVGDIDIDSSNNPPDHFRIIPGKINEFPDDFIANYSTDVSEVVMDVSDLLRYCLGLLPVYTADDVVSGKITRGQYTRNYRIWAGTDCCNPPYDERIHGKMPIKMPPAPPPMERK